MRKRLIVSMVYLLLAAIGHFVAWSMFPTVAPGFDLFLVITLAAGIKGGQLEGMLTGLVAGIVADAISGDPFGLHGFALTLCGYGVGLAASRVAEMTMFSAVFLAASGALLERLLVMGLRALFVAGTPTLVWWILPAVVVTSALLVWMTRVVGHAGLLFGGWRRRRDRGRLRL